MFFEDFLNEVKFNPSFNAKVLSLESNLRQVSANDGKFFEEVHEDVRGIEEHVKQLSQKAVQSNNAVSSQKKKKMELAVVDKSCMDAMKSVDAEVKRLEEKCSKLQAELAKMVQKNRVAVKTLKKVKKSVARYRAVTDLHIQVHDATIEGYAINKRNCKVKPFTLDKENLADDSDVQCLLYGILGDVSK